MPPRLSSRIIGQPSSRMRAIVSIGLQGLQSIVKSDENSRLLSSTSRPCVTVESKAVNPLRDIICVGSEEKPHSPRTIRGRRPRIGLLHKNWVRDCGIRELVSGQRSDEVQKLEMGKSIEQKALRYSSLNGFGSSIRGREESTVYDLLTSCAHWSVNGKSFGGKAEFLVTEKRGERLAYGEREEEPISVTMTYENCLCDAV